MVVISSMDDIDEDEEEQEAVREEETAEELALRKAKAAALLEAVQAKDLRAAFRAIEADAEVEYVFGDEEGTTGEGFTALMAACYRGDAQMAELLLKHGADPNYINGAGEHVLFWAIDGGADVLRCVCDHGADVDVITSRGWTPLSYATACQAFPRSYEPGTTPADILRNDYGASTFGAGPPDLWKAAQGVTVHEEGEMGRRVDQWNPGEDEEEMEARERVVLPDASEASKEWEMRSQQEADAKLEEEEEAELREIMGDMSRNPFIKEKGRAHRAS